MGVFLICASMALFSCAVDDGAAADAGADDVDEVSMAEAALTSDEVQPIVTLLWKTDGVPTRSQFLKTTLDIPANSTNVPAFDSLNRAYIRERSGVNQIPGTVRSMQLGSWGTSASFVPTLLQAIKDAGGCADCQRVCFSGAGGDLDANVVFDRDDRMYTAVNALGWSGTECPTSGVYKTFLLASTDFGVHWTATQVHADGTFALEHDYSPEPLEGPPAMLLWTADSGHVDSCYKPSTPTGRLDVIRPTWQGGTLAIPAPVPIEQGGVLPLIAHSGGGTKVITRDGVVYAAYVKTMSVTYDQACEIGTDTEPPPYSSPVHVAMVKDGNVYSWEAAKSYPVNDQHNQPAIALDTFGRLHLVAGMHNFPFAYRRGTVTGTNIDWDGPPTPTISDATIGVTVGSSAKQTYVALVRDRYDRLHISYRRERPDGLVYGLYYQRTNDDGTWRSDETMLVQPPTKTPTDGGAIWTSYSSYYHKLAIDHHGWLYTLFSWYTYKPAFAGWFLGEDSYKYAAILVSKDGGANWAFAQTKTFDDATSWDPESGAMADLDGNGMKDAVHVYWEEGLNVHIDNAVGTPSSWSWKNRGVRLTDGEKVLQYPVLAGNVNAYVNGQTDNRDDLVFVYFEPSTNALVLRTHFARADGRFDVYTSTQSDGRFDPYYANLIGDVTGDGNADVVMSYRRTCGLSVRTKASLGNGNWDTYTQCFSPSTMPNGGGIDVHEYPTRLGKVARTDATSPDPRADLVYMFRDADGFLYTRVLRSDGNGAWTQLPDQKHNDGSGINQYPHLLGDVNRDGKDDLVFVFRHWKGGAFATRVMYGNGDGTFTGSYQLQYANVPAQVPGYDAMIGDVNDDECADLVFPYRGSDDHYRIYTLVSSCQIDGRFTATTSPAMP